MGKYFGTDGFRGVANETLTAIDAFRVGRFLGRFSQGNGRARIVVGKDTRRSSYMFEYALAAGATASGADVYLLHVTTTPSVSYVVRTEGFDFGVMISASHNPYSDNGIKLFDAQGEKPSDEFLSRLENYIDGGSLPLATGDGVGRTVDFIAGRNRYLAYLLSLPRTSFRSLRVGLDCANGSAWQISKAVFDALGAAVYPIHAEPNGSNINAGCGSTNVSDLSALVLEKSLDVGFAFDGDADRCICVDERGRTVDGDGILYLCARDMLSRGELAPAGVVATHMSNRGLEESLAREGISLVRTDVGDRFVYEELVAGGYLLGGERSGHVIFRKHAATGDGILTALKVAEILTLNECPLSYLTEGLKLYPQRTGSVRVREKTAALSDPAVQKCAEEMRASLNGGRLLLRASGTEPVIRILAEGEDEAACERAVLAVERAVERAGEGA